MERIQKKANTFLYIHDNFLYISDKLQGDSRYFRCQLVTCRGRALWRLGDDVIITVAHNHPSNPRDIQALRFRQELRQRASLEIQPLRLIYDNLQVEDPEGALATGPFEGAIKRLMERARATAFPPVPATLEALHNSLINPQ